ncbi:roadblock/LC7 domain-containing protein [Nocardiopsis alborubida]|uniref:roadblock/LC7 domain-containing protein n=1 Tax=Nocardiopsis alborubida TaxID=146802 RepID=UPI00076E2FC7|nr:roadblock/LC7 domain-containing protein [Nocardiopsis alborubida]
MTPRNSPSTQGDDTGSDPLPELLSSFVHHHPGVEGALVFTRDGLIRAFSSTMPLEDAERWSAIASQLFSMAGSFARYAQRGTVEQLLLRMSDAFLLVMEATPASGLVLLASRDTQLKQAAFDATRLVENLQDALPQELSSKVGAPLLTGVAA